MHHFQNNHAAANGVANGIPLAEPVHIGLANGAKPVRKVKNQHRKGHDLFVDDEQILKNIHLHRGREFKKLEEEAAAFKAKYDDDEAQWATLFGFKLYRKTSVAKQRFWSNWLISRGFSLACGLGVAGSLLPILGMLSIPVLPAVIIAAIFGGITTLVNWRITKNKIPDFFKAIFIGKGKWFSNLFRYTDSEYKAVLKEYFAELDDRITALRLQLQELNEDLKQADRQGVRLGWFKRRELRSVEKELAQKLHDRDTGKMPARNLPWYKRLIVGVSLPLTIASGAIVSVLIYKLSLASLFTVLKLIPAFAALAGPPGWLIGIGILFAIMTAPAIAGLFTYGVSGLAKIHNSMKKAKNFMLDFFKKEIPNPKGEGIIKVYTFPSLAKLQAISEIRRDSKLATGAARFWAFLKLVAPTGATTKGALKLILLSGLTALVTYGQIFQMVGGGAVFLEIFNNQAAILATYVLPIMASAAQLPFYWLQTFQTGKGWFAVGRDYLRRPMNVLHERIVKVEALRASGELGRATADMLISKLEMEQATIANEEEKLANKTWFNGRVKIGKLLVKIHPTVRDLANFQIPRSMNAIGNGFISLYGAMISGAVPATDLPIAAGGITPDTSNNLTMADIVADIGGSAASFCAASKDTPEEPPAAYATRKMDELRAERHEKVALLVRKFGVNRNRVAAVRAADREREPLLGDFGLGPMAKRANQ